MLIAMQFVILIFSIICHEIAHGYTALLFGDETAKRAGRLTFNPISHLDPIGSLLLPALTFFSGSSLIFGWAKPVPVDTHNFQHPFRDMMWVGCAGPLANISIAVLCSFFYKIFAVNLTEASSVLMVYFLYFLVLSVKINLIIAVFNLIPIPPLDGSRVLAYFLPQNLKQIFYQIEPYGFVVVLILAYFGILGMILGFVLQPLFNILLPI